MDPSWIDQAFVWVQHPFALFVFLLVMAVLSGWLLYGYHKRQQRENGDCWDMNSTLQEEILALTGFLAESIALNRMPRGKQHTKQLEDLERRVTAFQREKQRELDERRRERKEAAARG